MAPFSVLRLERTTLTLDSLALPSLPIPSDSLAGWRAMATVALDCGLLLPLTNLAADERLLLRFDAAGRLVRLTSVRAPIGFLASRPESQELIGARRVGGLELVLYQWRWSPESRGASPEPSRSSR